VAGLAKTEQRRRAMEALETVGLGAYADSYPDELSGGMQQRVGLARALATRPSILLMDEAFSALDPLIRTEMQDELLKLQRENARTVVFVSHDLDETIRIGDRIAIMEGGAIVQVGTPQEIIEQPADDFVRSFFYGVDVSKVFRAQDIAVYDEDQVGEDGKPKGTPGTVPGEMPLNEVLHHVAHNEQPVAVVDEAGRYLGSIDKGRLLLTMDKTRQ
jgi:glycine betaine/proline transport system ATP-binding protein